MRTLVKTVFAVCVLGCLPSMAYAQASLAGVVRDASGAILPGVTVEAASPALIEKVRTAVTDNSGQYRIEDLRPGAYSVTFTLAGFSVVKREGIELSGSATALVNADMRVGGLEETITVTGEAPIVDVQNTAKERVMNHEVIDALPTGRSDRNLAMLVPAVSVTGGTISQDVGGTADQQNATMSVHGSRGGDQRIMYNGVSVGVAASGANSLMAPNMSAYQEVAVDTGADTAELGQGGVRVNFIPKDGGNRFSGTTFWSYTNTSFQGNNYSDKLKAAGLTTPDALRSLSDFNPGFGGPIKHDRIWFFAAYKRLNNDAYPAGATANANAGNLNAWTYVPTPNSRPYNTLKNIDYQVRGTWQVVKKVRVSFTDEHGDYCGCSADINSLSSPEASLWRTTPTQHNMMGDWSMPLTNKLLIQGAFLHRIQDQRRDVPPGTNPLMIPVIEQSLGNLNYRNVDPTTAASPNLRANRFMTGNIASSISYITGAHSFKAGFVWGISDEKDTLGNIQPGAQQVTYRFNNGVPNQITLYGYPLTSIFHTPSDSGLYAQDKWTIQHLTVSYGVRYERYVTSFPAQTAGPTQLTPNRNVFYPAGKGVSWNDLTPKSGLAWDPWGDGKTAIKTSLNKYIQGEGPSGIGGTALAPINRTTNVTTRSWNDANTNYVPDCDLTNSAANGECGPDASSNFGNSVTTTTYDPKILSGWGIRTFDWEFSAGAQRQIHRGTSVDVSYFRRWYGNFFVTDNLAIGPNDVTAFSVVAPTADNRLPSAGQTISGFYDQNFVGAVNNYVTKASNYGRQTDHWNGVDFSISSRLSDRFFVQGGTSTGRETTNSCAIRAKVPESALLNPFCAVTPPWLTSMKVQASYTVPLVDVQVSGNVQSIPGPALGANYVVTSAQVQPSLGRPLSGGTANVTVPLVAASSLYPSRINQTDMRFTKRFKLQATTKAAFNFDVYNILNSNSTLGINSTFNPSNPTIWQRPTSVMQARLLKVSLQFDF